MKKRPLFFYFQKALLILTNIRPSLYDQLLYKNDLNALVALMNRTPFGLHLLGYKSWKTHLIESPYHFDHWKYLLFSIIVLLLSRL